MGNGLYHIFAGLVDEFGTAFRVGLSFFGVAFGEEGKELVVAGELRQVLTSCFDADARSALNSKTFFIKRNALEKELRTRRGSNPRPNRETTCFLHAYR